MNVRVSAVLIGGLMCLSLPALAGPPRQAVVTRPVADMFSKPSRDADVVSQAIYSTTVEVLKKQGRWSNIKTPDEYTGWVETKALRALRGATYPAGGRTAQVTSLRAHIYREASVTTHAPLVTIPFEARLEVLREGASESKNGDERWIEVRLPDSHTGWVQRGDVTLPYTWGGSSALGYDCSGFTQMLCRRGGVNIPRDAQPQADWEGMTKVARSELQPGDLLYFGDSADKITHTGFYLGAGEFIHATTNTRPVIQISRLEDNPWTGLLVACRRWKK